MPTTNISNNAPLKNVYSPQALNPLLSAEIKNFLYNHPTRLSALVGQYGSPINLVWPQAFELNTRALQAVLDQREIQHVIFYGAKANKSRCLLGAAAAMGIGVDVSSIHEMHAALRAGLPAGQLCATGPAKTAAFHQALLRAGSLICVDSLEEFDHVKTLIETQPGGAKARILLRYRPKSCPSSRFGMGADDLLLCLQTLTRTHALFDFEGFHFHLGGYGFESRANAFREVTDFVEAAREMGLSPKMIDIGGGLPIRYIESQAYARFLQNDNTPSHYYNQSAPTSYYPYGSEISAAHWLNALLESACSPTHTIADYLKTHNLTLALEPGRSLVDQAAITVFRVTRTKRLANNNNVIFVEGSSFSACETWFASEYLVDPILITSRTEPATPAHAFIAGHSCLDDDVITHRLINFISLPLPGDLLVYANTAGYQMDLLENEFHRHPLPRRLVATCGTHGNYAFSPDDEREHSQ